MQAKSVEIPRVGEMLAQARRQRGMTISDVAASTKVSSRYLQALEDEALAQLPSRIHAIGFARSFAKCVRLDAEEIGSAIKQRLEFDSATQAHLPCENGTSHQFARLYRSVRARLFA